MAYRDTEDALRAKIESLEEENRKLRALASYRAGGSIYDPESAVYWKNRAATMEALYLKEMKRKSPRNQVVVTLRQFIEQLKGK
jgi:hypothetical protein